MNTDACKTQAINIYFILIYFCMFAYLQLNKINAPRNIYFISHLFYFNGSKLLKQNKINAKRDIYFILFYFVFDVQNRRQRRYSPQTGSK